MSTPVRDDHGYPDARGTLGHEPRQDSARRIIVIFSILILGIGLMIFMWWLGAPGDLSKPMNPP